MKTLLAIFTLVLLHGCASDLLPSLKYCQSVDYERKGIDMKLKAECRVPAG